MSSFTPDKDFVYPDPSFYGRTTGPYPHGPTIPSGVVASQSTDRAPAAAPIIPSTAGAIAPPSPPFAIDPVLLALPRPAPVLSPAPVLAAHNPAPTCPVSAAIHDNLSTDKGVPIEMKAEAQGTPIPPVQDGDDLQKAQKRKRDRDGNSKDNKTGDGGSEDASTKV